MILTESHEKTRLTNRTRNNCNVLHNCSFNSQIRMKTFFTSFFQVGLVAINTYLITHLYWLGIFIVSFLISLLWAFNVSKIAISTTNQKLTYALGAGCGAICGLIILQLILN